MPIYVELSLLTDFFTTGGHVHDGGVNVLLLINGNVICDSKALYGSNGKGIDSMSVCETPMSVKKNDIISLTANYDLEAHPAYVQAPLSCSSFSITNIHL